MGIVLILVLQVFSGLLIARALLSWFPIQHDSNMYGVSRFLHSATEPVLAPIRRILPRTGRVDFSVLVTLLAVTFVLIPVAAAI